MNSLVEESEFGPWGEVLAGGTQSKYQFTGQEKDDETGLNYMNARYYGADMHRFTQPDTLLQNVYDPQMLNRYAYARNNPLKYIDPSGKVVTCNARGCSSSISVLNTPKPQSKPQSFQQFVSNIPKPQPPKPAPPQNQPSRQSAPSNNGGGSSGSSSSSNSGPSVNGASTSQEEPKRVSNPTPTEVASQKDHSSIGSGGVCLNGNYGALVFGTASICGVVTGNREAGVIFSPGGGGTTGIATGLSVGGMLSTAQNFDEMLGVDAFAGGSAWVPQVDASWDSQNTDIRSVYGGLGIPLPIDVSKMGVPVPVEFHGGAVNNIPVYYKKF